MIKNVVLITILCLTITQSNLLNGQPASISDNLTAQPIPDRSVFFNLSDTGEYKPITWGLDLAWLSESNIRRGIAFMGTDYIDVVRSSFTPTAPLINGALQQEELNRLNERLGIIDLLGAHTKVVLNCDHPRVDPWFKDENGVGIPSRWAELMDVTTRLHQEHGRIVITISPFNEPDYTGTGQGTITDFYNIAGELRQNSRFDNIRISGGNTLNNDVALGWFNTLEDRLDEGNTHQLAGSFDSYANFYQSVSSRGFHATNDELHNVMEAMVGVQYGMNTGIWWGTAELARGEFVKASHGMRLSYNEHRPNWTAASVYRNLEGKIQAFGGSSERQARTTTYRFVSKERDVYYDGYGPQREYTMVIPGGTGYQQGQTNAERVVSITWGDDIQPVIDGRYIIVNRNSGKVLEVAGGSVNSGANLQQGNNTGGTYQQWNVTPVDSRIGGDFSYFSFTAVHSGKSLDILNFSLNNGGNVIVWDDVKSANQQWYLDYAEDGWFYIRSRLSAKCLDVANLSTSNGANVNQWDKNQGANQQWRFIPIGAPVEFDAPSVPKNLIATANKQSIKLEWDAIPDSDLSSYTIYRSQTPGGPYNTIARNIKVASFVDNTVQSSIPYYYVVKSIDNSLNYSINYSNQVSATITGDNEIVAHFQFETNNLDSSINLNHGASYGNISYLEGKEGNTAIKFNGSNSFLQLPATIANHKEITIATWVYWNGGNIWQRIFDFGNGESQNMFLTPNSGAGQLRFAIKNGGGEQILNGPMLPTREWFHIAVTLGDSGAKMYVNGILVNESNAITIRPIDFKPVLNYIGRSQYPDPLFNGNIDDFRIYNYELSINEITQLLTPLSIDDNNLIDNSFSLLPVPANDVLLFKADNLANQSAKIKIFDTNGRLVWSKTIFDVVSTEIDISKLSAGIYIFQITTKDKISTRKFMKK